jgi:hypothetical protein
MIGAWGFMERYSVDPTQVGPVADASVGELYLVEGQGELQLNLINRGGETLLLEGIDVDDPRFTVTYDDWVLAPGKETTIKLSFQDDGADVSAELCLATNSAGHPALHIPISTTKSGSSLALGTQAPDFTLTDTGGVTHQLSAQLGNPVLLVYFATW